MCSSAHGAQRCLFNVEWCQYTLLRLFLAVPLVLIAGYSSLSLKTSVDLLVLSSALDVTFFVQECARYLETYKAYETKPADLIQGRADEDYLSKLNAALTTVRGVNRTDVLTLAGAFKTAAGIMTANMQELSALPGIGPTKVCNSTSEMGAVCFRAIKRTGAMSGICWFRCFWTICAVDNVAANMPFVGIQVLRFGMFDRCGGCMKLSMSPSGRRYNKINSNLCLPRLQGRLVPQAAWVLPTPQRQLQRQQL